MHWLTTYAADITKTAAVGGATEHSYRTPIEIMLRAASNEFGANVNILQEPGRAKNLGAPDFRVAAADGGVVGYVECKTPGADLQKLTTKAQLQKYRALSENILLTDSWRWLLLRAGKTAAAARLSEKPGKKERDDAAQILRTFITAEVEKISDSKRLAAALAHRCAMLRRGLAQHENDEQSRLHGLLHEFQKTLDRDLDFPRFADVFAQTLVYSLLMAKLSAPEGDKLNLDTARRRIPANFAVIRQIMTFLPEMEDAVYAGIHWIVGDILAIVNAMDKAAVAESMSYKKGVSDEDDPYLNFYETFLSKYDAKLRESRGVYYTPPPVVKFIVRAADDLLRRDFAMPDGLAQNGVVALDFAAGTGTFMLEMARAVFAGKSAAKRDILAREHFLPNFYGFELMASPYVISHLKLSRFLAENDVALQNGERIKIYLANTLEKIDAQIESAFMPELAKEAKEAQTVKDSPVLVIVGNPPYSGHSQNKSAEQYEREHKRIKGKRVMGVRDTWIGGLLRGFDGDVKIGGGYYEVDGKPLGEKNPKWLQDDYVKFLRFAQWKMDAVERGIVAVITNHGFLDNPTFRGMRQSLLSTFDALYFLDLHGNSKKKERAPDGGKDENVFDIQQGVAVSLLVKNPAAKKKGVFHKDLWGMRKEKNKACLSGSVNSIKWKTVKPAAPSYLFVPRNGREGKKYKKFYPLRDIFSAGNAGLVTGRDALYIHHTKKEMREALRESGGKYRESPVKPVAYRPFDNRLIYYDGKLLARARKETMLHMLEGGNLALATVRQVKAGKTWQHCFSTTVLLESTFISNTTGEINYLFPLYRFHNGMGNIVRDENFTAEFRRWIDARCGKTHSPENILGCIYAVLHSPDYRGRYADFLRADFPRIPFPKENGEFNRLAKIGNALIAAHLLQKNCRGKFAKLRGEGTSHIVERVRYDEDAGRLWFNKGEYFAPLPPEIFHFQIGGYKPLDKYLKSRKGRQLSLHEIDTMEKAANAVAFTVKKMAEIDGGNKK